MTHQQLDRAHIGAGFEQMGGEAVPQRVRRDRLFDPRYATGFLAGLLHRRSSDRAARYIALEQPYVGMRDLPVSTQDLEQLRREHDVTIFPVLTLCHAQHHALTINIGDLQPRGLGDPQSRRVRGHQNGAVFEAGNRLQEVKDFLAA
jgi:hypothetical protein